MQGCDLVFTPETAEKVKTELRRQLGGVCPCDNDRRCPLLPDDFTALMVPGKVTDAHVVA